MTAFVEAHVRAQTCQADALSLASFDPRHLWLVLEDLFRQELGGEARLANTLCDAFLGREIGNRYYRDLTDVSVPTATNDLVRLHSSGFLRALGAGRTRRYLAGPRLMPLVAESAGLPSSLVDPHQPIKEQRAAILVTLARASPSRGRVVSTGFASHEPVRSIRRT